MTEDIVTGLSRFSYLRVIARSSTSRYTSEAVDVRSAGKELGARYVMEGTLRQAGTKLRIAVQLVDAISGAHLWAETYLHSFNPEAIFEVSQLPSGEVLAVKLKHSSGNSALDTAIERAILKSSPLPKPDDPASFQRELVIKYKPFEE